MSGLKKTLNTIGDFGKNAMGAINAVAVTRMAATGAAVAGLAVAGTKSFVDIQNSMNEVFTLMPGNYSAVLIFIAICHEFSRMSRIKAEKSVKSVLFRGRNNLSETPAE